MYKGVNVVIDLFHGVVHEKLNPSLPQVYHNVNDDRDAHQNYDHVPTHCKYLCEQAVDSDPRVYIDDGAEEDAHELIVIGDKYEVLVGHRHA